MTKTYTAQQVAADAAEILTHHRQMLAQLKELDAPTSRIIRQSKLVRDAQAALRDANAGRI